MTKDEFTSRANSVIRMGAGMMAGVLAARGMASAGNEVVMLAAAAALPVAGLAWSFIEKNATAAKIVGALPTDDLSALIATVGQFRAQGASPLLVAHLAQTAAALAVAETQTSGPPLAVPATVPAPPADAVVPPPPAPPGVSPSYVEQALAPAAVPGAFLPQVVS